MNLGTGIDNAYLTENLSLYLDDVLVDELLIGADLKGNAITRISISGSGAGNNREEATTDALNNMKNLQTILETGSLPVKLNIVKTDSISPTLGSSFVRNASYAGILALIAVVLLIASKIQTANNIYSDNYYCALRVHIDTRRCSTHRLENRYSVCRSTHYRDG
jgi:preprotein translocase subunit SecD